MIYEIRFTLRAELDIQLISNYLDSEWGVSVTDKFLESVDELLEKISVSPKMFQCSSKKRKIHKCVINPRVILYYKILDDRIELLTFFQTRQHPGKLKF